MAEEKESEFGFRVIDKRTLREDGTRREPKSEENRTVQPQTEPPRPSAGPPTPVEEEVFEQGPPSFEMLVSYLSTTAMFQLGLIPGPSGERIPVDLINARRTIDLLEVLRDKTQGNLSRSEAKLLDDVLYELRLTFVEIDRRMAQESR